MSFFSSRLTRAPLIWIYIHFQARIALLEGERRSFENVKVDLMRRIKMLEYALRMERQVSRQHLSYHHR